MRYLKAVDDVYQLWVFRIVQIFFVVLSIISSRLVFSRSHVPSVNWALFQSLFYFQSFPCIPHFPQSHKTSTSIHSIPFFLSSNFLSSYFESWFIFRPSSNWSHSFCYSPSFSSSLQLWELTALVTLHALFPILDAHLKLWHSRRQVIWIMRRFELPHLLALPYWYNISS